VLIRGVSVAFLLMIHDTHQGIAPASARVTTALFDVVRVKAGRFVE